MADTSLSTWLTFVGSILTGLFTFIVAWFSLRRQLTRDRVDAHKIERDAAKVIEEAALSLVNGMRIQVKEARTELEDLRADLSAANDKIAVFESDYTRCHQERLDLRAQIRILEKALKALDQGHTSP